MNDQNQDYIEPQIYSITGFKDTLASPLFYSVAVVALVLGVASIFGFLQNPLKLKAMANAVHNKINISSPVSSSSYKNNRHSLEQSFQEHNHNAKTQPINYINDSLNQPEFDLNVENADGFHRVSFNYDVTANDFWTGLDTSRLESATEQSDRNDLESSLLGAPLESEYHQKLEQKSMPLNDSMYSLKTRPTSI